MKIIDNEPNLRVTTSEIKIRRKSKNQFGIM